LYHYIDLRMLVFGIAVGAVLSPGLILAFLLCYVILKHLPSVWSELRELSLNSLVIARLALAAAMISPVLSRRLFSSNVLESYAFPWHHYIHVRYLMGGLTTLAAGLVFPWLDAWLNIRRIQWQKRLRSISLPSYKAMGTFLLEWAIGLGLFF